MDCNAHRVVKQMLVIITDDVKQLFLMDYNATSLRGNKINYKISR